MSAAAILAECARLGVQIVAEGQSLRFKPQSRVSAALRDQIVEHKAEILVALRPVELPPARGCRACDGRLFVRVRTGPAWICLRCHPVRAGEVVEEHRAPEPSRWHAWRERPRNPQPATRNLGREGAQ